MSNQVNGGQDPLAYSEYKADLKFRNKVATFANGLLFLVCFFQLLFEWNWIRTIMFAAIWFFFCSFVGLPAIINTHRCAKIWGKQVISICLFQLVWLVIFGVVLRWTNLIEYTFPWILGGIFTALSMPQRQLEIEAGQRRVR